MTYLGQRPFTTGHVIYFTQDKINIFKSLKFERRQCL